MENQKNRQKTEWTDERTDLLKKLVADKMSASEIGRALGITKNMVSGKCRRLGIKLCSIDKPTGPRARFERMERAKAAAAALKPVLDANDPGPMQYLKIWEMKRGVCHWPLWGKTTAFEDKRFCGRKAVQKSVYCAEHKHMAGEFYRQRRAAPSFALKAIKRPA